jgi:hypothetical protein
MPKTNLLTPTFTMKNAFSTPKVNSNGGFYNNGIAHDLTKKTEVAVIYERLQRENGEAKVSVRKLASAAKVSPKFAHKLLRKIDGGEGLSDPRQEAKERIIHGAGSKTFTAVNEAILLRIHTKNPSTPLTDYRQALYQRTGTLASEFPVCRWFLTAVPYKGSMIKSSLVSPM